MLELYASVQPALIFFIIFIASLTVHEWAHAWTADKLGDCTPRNDGRVTLNPAAHIDPIGTIAIPVMLYVFNPAFQIMGWGKPVMTNPKNYRSPIWGEIIVSLAGPAANLVIALGAGLLSSVLKYYEPSFQALTVRVVVVNCSLMIFNLLPIAPLDGSHVLKHCLRLSDEAFLRWSQWGGIALLILINIQSFNLWLGRMIYTVAFGIMKLTEF